MVSVSYQIKASVPKQTQFVAKAPVAKVTRFVAKATVAKTPVAKLTDIRPFLLI
jgi:hypothetical protein